MRQEIVEEYLAAIYRLRVDAETPLALSKLTSYFDFSPVSVHEMIIKLSSEEWVIYHPYHGVTLTSEGEAIAQDLLRRHRLWERFLTDKLNVPWDEAHDIAGRLEHATNTSVTDRLADFLGTPAVCPHGAPIPPAHTSSAEQCLSSLPVGAEGRITRISPESAELLHRLHIHDLHPGHQFHILQQSTTATTLTSDDETINIPKPDAQAVWAEVF